MHGRLDGAEHDGDVGAQAHTVGGAVGLQPFLGVDLVRAQVAAHLVVEDLGRRARQGPQPRVHEPAQIAVQGLAEAAGSFRDLQGGEAVDVDAGRRGPHRPDHVEVVVAVEAGMYPTLQADLGRALSLGLGHPTGDLVELQQVGVAPEVEGEGTLGEGAEPALEGADVGVVDVAVGHPGDHVADRLPAQLVGHLGHGGHLGATGGEQAGEPVHARLLAQEHVGQDLAHPAPGPGGRREQGRRGHVGPREPAVARLAPEAFGVGADQHRGGHGRVEPPLRGGGELRVERQAGSQREAPGLGHLAQEVERGPGSLGVDVVRGHGRHPAPVVDARVEQAGEVLGKVGRPLHVHVGRKEQAGHGQGPQVLLRGARRRAVHGRARLGQEVLDDDLLHVAVAVVGRGDGLQGDEAVGPGLAYPAQDAGGEGDRLPTGGLEGGQPAGRGLVGRAGVAGQVGVERLEHHPLAGRHDPEPGQLGRIQGSGVGVGEKARLVAHQGAHGGQVLDRRGVALLVEPATGRGIAVLGPLAQREQGLVAAGPGSGPGDLQHLLG